MQVIAVRLGALRVRVSEDPAADAARSLANRLSGAIRRRGAATLALSGGSTAPPMLAALVGADLDWTRMTIWQVDERIAPDGHDDRNAGQLCAVPVDTRLMPVTARDVAAAGRRYAAGLPDRFDVVHLGLGDDGHTASWPPAPHPGAGVVHDPEMVATVAEFNGRERMTLTPGPVNRARSRVILTTGAAKAEMVRRWIDADPTIPMAHVRRSGTTLFLDRAAASALSL